MSQPTGPQPIKYTMTATKRAPSAREDVPPPRAVVWVDAQRLDPSQRRAAARIAGVPVELVDRLAAQHQPMPVERFDDKATAEARARALSAELPGVQAADPAHLKPAWALWAPLIAFLGSLPLLLVFWPLIPLVWLAGAVALGMGLSQGWKAEAAMRQALAQLDAASAPVSSARAQALIERARALRQLLEGLDIVDAARRDIEQSLTGVLGDLSELAHAEANADAAARLAIEASYSRIEDALATLAPSLDQARGPGETSDAAQRLAQQAKALQLSVAELGGPRTPPKQRT